MSLLRRVVVHAFVAFGTREEPGSDGAAGHVAETADLGCWVALPIPLSHSGGPVVVTHMSRKRRIQLSNSCLNL